MTYHLIITFLCSLFFTILSSAQPFTEKPKDCPIIIINQSKFTETFYLIGKDNDRDSITIDTISPGCIQMTSNATFLGLDTKKSKSRLLFFKDNGKPVKITYFGGKQFSVEGSSLDSMWHRSANIQDSLFKVVERCESRSSRDSIFLATKEKYESWCFYEFISLLRNDTSLAIRFLNYHVRNLRRVAFTSPVYMDSLISIVATFDPQKEDLLSDLTDLGRLRIGSNVYHFNFITINDDTISTSNIFKNKNGEKILIDFWASWCKPCREKNQHLKSHYAALQMKNIQILGISLDEKPSAWKYALTKDELPWLQGLNPYEYHKEIQKKYNCYAIPMSLLFSSEGKLLQINPTLEDLLNN